MLSSMSARSLVIGVVLCVCAGLLAAQGIGDRNRPQGLGNYRITGKVVLPDGRPAKDVVVNFTGTESPASTYRTNETGEFEISGLSNGNYTVSVRVDGYRPESETVNINGGGAGQSFPVVFYLKMAASANPLMKGVPKDALSKYEKGMDKATKDDWKGAITDFDAAIAAYPNFAAA